MSRPVALVLRALGLGDFLTGLPATRLVRRLLPDHHLVLAASPQFESLMPLIGYVDEFVPAGELTPIAEFTDAVDIGIDLHGNGIASRRIVAELAPRRLIGFANPSDGLTGPDWRAAEHEIDRWCRLVRTLGSSRAAQRWSPAHCVAAPEIDAGQGITVLHPGAAHASRRWPPERFIEVGQQLSDAGHELVVTGSESEARLVQAVAGRVGAIALVEPPLPVLFALVAAARLVVSGDTGVAHVASNYRTPSVTLFGPVSPARWGPPPEPQHVALFHGDGRGDPHGAVTDNALMRISVGEVLSAIDGIESKRHEARMDRTG